MIAFSKSLIKMNKLNNTSLVLKHLAFFEFLMMMVDG